MALPLHLLRIFATVVEANGFSNAAQILHISQPAVSKGVKELESQLGIALIERGERGVRLTAAGEALSLRAREILAVERQAEAEVRAIRGLASGALRLGASSTIAAYHLPSSVAAFAVRYPRIDLRLASGNTTAIVALLLAREIELGFVEAPVTDPGIVATAWRDEELVMIAAPTHRLARRKRAATTADLADEIFVVREPGSGTRAIAEDMLGQMDVPIRNTVEAGSTEAVKQLVAAGLGLAIMSRAAASDQLALRKLRLISLPQPVHRRTLWRISLLGRQEGPSAQAFQRLAT